MRDRQHLNLRIHEIVGEYLLNHPELRYIQALWALGIIDKEDRFHEEPRETLDKILNLCYNEEK